MSERLNIKNMLVEPEKISEKKFDPERDITDEVWRHLATERESSAKKRSWEDYAIFVSSETLLGRKPEILPELWGWLAKQRDQAKENDNWLSFFSLAAREKIIGGNPPISEDEFKILSGNVSGSTDDLALFSQFATSALILGKKINIEKPIWEKIIERRKQLFKDGDFRFLSLAKNEAILGKQPELSDIEWDKIREMTNDFKNEENWGWYALNLSTQATLAADEIKIPEGGGLELIFHKKKPKPEINPPLPNQRKF